MELKQIIKYRPKFTILAVFGTIMLFFMVCHRGPKALHAKDEDTTFATPPSLVQTQGETTTTEGPSTETTSSITLNIKREMPSTSDLKVLLSNYKSHTLDSCLQLGGTIGKKDTAIKNAEVIFQGNKSIEKSFDVLFRTNLHTRPILNRTRTNCTDVIFSETVLPYTALASIPGSGNTWSRHLIELITGIYTGSVFDNILLAQRFPGELHSKIAGDTIVIKTHGGPSTGIGPTYTRVVLVIRNKLDALKAEYKRRHFKGIVGNIASFNVVEFKQFASAWSSKLNFYKDWIEKAMSENMDIFLLFYDDLIHDLGRALVKLAYFLGASLEPDILLCTMQNREGHFHRPPSSLVNLEHLANNTDQTDKYRLMNAITECLRKEKCVASGCGFLYM